MKEKIIKMIESKEYGAILELFSNMNEVDIATVFDELSEKDTVKLFRMLRKDDAAEVFAHLDHSMQQAIIESISDKEITSVIDDMFLDDVVDLVEEMPANVVRKVLQNVPQEKRELINQFLSYPEDSVGSIMTIEYVNLKEDNTVQEAFEYIRKTGLDKETVYTCYVISRDRLLLGVVSVKTLLLSNLDDKIGDIMDTNVIYASTTDDQEIVTTHFRKYGWIAMPVVDKEHRLVGIVTIDDVVHVIDEENTEDFEKMAALNPSDDPYLKTSVIDLAKNRIVWLFVLMISAIATGGVIENAEDALTAFPVLMGFIPMLMDTGGNAGAQASTLVIRGMALDEIRTKDMFAVLWKEIRVAALCGFALSLVTFVRIYFMNGRDILLCIAVTSTLFITVIIAKGVGCLLPMAAKKLKMDPAIMASPVITTIVDVSALIIYFRIATTILKV